jgi:hypothetical protein
MDVEEEVVGMSEAEILRERTKVQEIIDSLVAHWTGKVRDLTERYTITQDIRLEVAAACYTTALMELQFATQHWIEEGTKL